MYEYMKINHNIFQIISTNEAYATIIRLQSAIFQSIRLILKLKKEKDKVFKQEEILVNDIISNISYILFINEMNNLKYIRY